MGPHGYLADAELLWLVIVNDGWSNKDSQVSTSGYGCILGEAIRIDGALRGARRWTIFVSVYACTQVQYLVSLPVVKPIHFPNKRETGLPWCFLVLVQPSQQLKHLPTHSARESHVQHSYSKAGRVLASPGNQQIESQLKLMTATCFFTGFQLKHHRTMFGFLQFSPQRKLLWSQSTTDELGHSADPIGPRIFASSGCTWPGKRLRKQDHPASV